MKTKYPIVWDWVLKFKFILKYSFKNGHIKICKDISHSH